MPAAIGVVLIGVIFLTVLLWTDVLTPAFKRWREHRRLKNKSNMDIIFNRAYQERAEENAKILYKTVDLLQELVAADEVMPILNDRQKLEAESIIKEYIKLQLGG